MRSSPSDKHSQRLSKALLIVGGHVFVSRDTSLSELNVTIRSLASALGCEAGRTVTGLCAHGVLHDESKTVVHEFTVTNGIDRDTIHELYELHCPWFFTGATAPLRG